MVEFTVVVRAARVRFPASTFLYQTKNIVTSNKTLAEMTFEEKQKVSARTKVFLKLKDYLNNI